MERISIDTKQVMGLCLSASLLLMGAVGFAQEGTASEMKVTYSEKVLKFARHHIGVTDGTLQLYGCLTEANWGSTDFSDLAFATRSIDHTLRTVQAAVGAQTAQNREAAVVACKSLVRSTFGAGAPVGQERQSAIAVGAAQSIMRMLPKVAASSKARPTDYGAVIGASATKGG